MYIFVRRTVEKSGEAGFRPKYENETFSSAFHHPSRPQGRSLPNALAPPCLPQGGAEAIQALTFRPLTWYGIDAVELCSGATGPREEKPPRWQHVRHTPAKPSWPTPAARP
jgi:hypothetical protein